VADVLSLKPDFALLGAVGFDTVVKGVGVTAKGTGDYDIVTRYFNPWAGVNEDPVTGSVHTLLTTFWSAILGKKELRAYQASERGGEMLIRLLDNGRLEMLGKAVIVSAGELYI
jgi:predicted PhzF superfamily epimerase YddE/YHI9